MSINNQNKLGYKHTPHGWIPEEWEVKELGDVLTLKRGYDLTNTQRRQGNIPVITSGGVNGYHDTAMVKAPGVVTGRYGTVGEVYYCESDFWPHNTTLYVHEFKRVKPIYAYHLLRSINFKKYSDKSAVQGINRNHLHNEVIAIPSNPIEQCYIAAILFIWDKAITKTLQLIDQIQQRNKGLMQQLLNPKTDWKEKKLSDIFERVVRKNTSGSTNVVTISAQRGFVKQNDFFNKIVASETLDNYFLIRKGEFCYNKSYSNGYDWGATKRLNCFDEAVVTTLYICFRIKDEKKYSGDFFEYFFHACLLDHGLSKIAHEGGRAHGLLNVTPGDFFNLKISVPDYNEQLRIFNILSKTTLELKLFKQKLAVLQQQKKGLMQKLLTGEIRVKVDKSQKLKSI